MMSQSAGLRQPDARRTKEKDGRHAMTVEERYGSVAAADAERVRQPAAVTW